MAYSRQAHRPWLHLLNGKMFLIVNWFSWRVETQILTSNLCAVFLSSLLVVYFKHSWKTSFIIYYLTLLETSSFLSFIAGIHTWSLIGISLIFGNYLLAMWSIEESSSLSGGCFSEWTAIDHFPSIWLRQLHHVQRHSGHLFREDRNLSAPISSLDKSVLYCWLHSPPSLLCQEHPDARGLSASYTFSFSSSLLIPPSLFIPSSFSSVFFSLNIWIGTSQEQMRMKNVNRELCYCQIAASRDTVMSINLKWFWTRLHGY